VLIRGPEEGVAVLAIDLYRHDDAEQTLSANRGNEQAGYLRRARCDRSLYSCLGAVFGKGLPKGTKVLTICCMLRSISAMFPLCRITSEASA